MHARHWWQNYHVQGIAPRFRSFHRSSISLTWFFVVYLRSVVDRPVTEGSPRRSDESLARERSSFSVTDRIVDEEMSFEWTFHDDARLDTSPLPKRAQRMRKRISQSNRDRQAHTSLSRHEQGAKPQVNQKNASSLHAVYGNDGKETSQSNRGRPTFFTVVSSRSCSRRFASLKTTTTVYRSTQREIPTGYLVEAARVPGWTVPTKWRWTAWFPSFENPAISPRNHWFRWSRLSENAVHPDCRTWPLDCVSFEFGRTSSETSAGVRCWQTSLNLSKRCSDRRKVTEEMYLHRYWSRRRPYNLEWRSWSMFWCMRSLLDRNASPSAREVTR